MMRGREITLCALARSYGIAPKCAGILMALQDARFGVLSTGLGELAECSQESVRVYISTLRQALGPGSIISNDDRPTTYKLSPIARAELTRFLDEVMGEVRCYVSERQAA